VHQRPMVLSQQQQQQQQQQHSAEKGSVVAEGLLGVEYLQGLVDAALAAAGLSANPADDLPASSSASSPLQRHVSSDGLSAAGALSAAVDGAEARAVVEAQREVHVGPDMAGSRGAAAAGASTGMPRRRRRKATAAS
jgi:hypothetical protein